MLTRPVETWVADDRQRWSAKISLSFLDLYFWVAVVAVLDVLVTWFILELGGSELNPIADYMIQRAGFLGISLLKIGSLFVVLMAVELLSQRRLRLARRLTVFWLAMWTFPPLFGAMQLWQLI